MKKMLIYSGLAITLTLGGYFAIQALQRRKTTGGKGKSKGNGDSPLERLFSWFSEKDQKPLDEETKEIIETADFPVSKRSKGKQVEKIQQFLHNLMPDAYGQGEVDGNWGDRTSCAWTYIVGVKADPRITENVFKNMMRDKRAKQSYLSHPSKNKTQWFNARYGSSFKKATDSERQKCGNVLGVSNPSII